MRKLDAVNEEETGNSLLYFIYLCIYVYVFASLFSLALSLFLSLSVCVCVGGIPWITYGGRTCSLLPSCVLGIELWSQSWWQVLLITMLLSTSSVSYTWAGLQESWAFVLISPLQHTQTSKGCVDRSITCILLRKKKWRFEKWLSKYRNINP